jgi:hypothetical protein
MRKNGARGGKGGRVSRSRGIKSIQSKELEPQMDPSAHPSAALTVLGKMETPIRSRVPQSNSSHFVGPRSRVPHSSHDKTNAFSFTGSAQLKCLVYSYNITTVLGLWRPVVLYTNRRHFSWHPAWRGRIPNFSMTKARRSCAKRLLANLLSAAGRRCPPLSSAVLYPIVRNLVAQQHRSFLDGYGLVYSADDRQKGQSRARPGRRVHT